MFPLALLPLLLKLVLLLGERVFQQFRQSVCSVAANLCLGVCLLFTRLPTNFSAVHSVVIVCAGDIRLLFFILFYFILFHFHCIRQGYCSEEGLERNIRTIQASPPRNYNKARPQHREFHPLLFPISVWVL